MTPAVEQLDAAGVDFSVDQYEHDTDVASYGAEAAQKLGLDPDEVFKTLVAALDDGRLVVAIVPTSGRLDLKALAQAAGTKKARMADPEDVERSTGYVLGGVSPFGQRRPLATFVDETAQLFDRINVSGGKRGLELRLAPDDLRSILDATYCAIAAP